MRRIRRVFGFVVMAIEVGRLTAHGSASDGELSAAEEAAEGASAADVLENWGKEMFGSAVMRRRRGAGATGGVPVLWRRRVAEDRAVFKEVEREDVVLPTDPESNG
jgi:hypothetical protein